MFNSLSLTKKLTLFLIVILTVGFLSFTLFSTYYAQSIITQKVHTQLTKRVSSIKDMMMIYDDSLKSIADDLFNAFSSQFDNIQIDASQTVTVEGVQTPLITNNGEKLNLNFDFVDNYTKIKGSTATVFARMGDDFVRVTTSLKRPDGSRTLGTFLGTKSPAYEKIMNKEKYFGTAHLFGSDYMAVYNPIIKDGKVIGILYVGYNYTSSYKKLIKRIKDIKIGDTGYVYILSTKNKTKGKVILHPSLEGKNLIKIADEKGYDFVKELYKGDKGSIDYLWKDKVKSVVYENYSERGWKLVLGTNIEEFLGESYLMQNIMFALSITLIGVVACILFFTIRSLVIKPLHKLQIGLNEFFDFLNGKKDKIDDIKASSQDEIGQMATLINKSIHEIETNINIDNELIADTVKVSSSVSNGYLDQRITKNSNNAKLNELKDVVNKMLQNIQNRINNVQDVLSSYTEFDYTASVNTSEVQAQIKELYESTNNLGIATTQMLKLNLQNGLSLESNSSELNEIIDRLSTSANTQASSLEETAASLEELTSAMNSNEENIHKMLRNSKLLSSEVSNGQALAQNTATAMDNINEQTQAIAEAITVIDQIAFQTNILSLNAAVEAATAGEAGKGFAVVAGEVRNLASRSAEAAKEIKDLVENATLKTDEGKQTAQSMISGYEKLKENIETTTTIITDVTNNSKEQLESIHLINNTVASLDTLTQENAQVATNANEISRKTKSIANIIVEDVNKKSF